MTNLAFSPLPQGSPRVPEYSPEHTRHIEIVTSRSQRRARPRLVYALVAVAGLFLILMAQLLLSIVLSKGAYEISSLQVAQTNLTRDQQTVTEQLNVLGSPQSLSAKAAALGMVQNNVSTTYLRLSDGAVIGTPAAAAAGAPGDNALIANALIGTPVDPGAPTPPGTPGAPTTPTSGTPTSGAPTTGTTTGSVPSIPGALPAPNTH
jgi:hypothetical protein